MSRVTKSVASDNNTGSIDNAKGDAGGWGIVGGDDRSDTDVRVWDNARG